PRIDRVSPLRLLLDTHSFVWWTLDDPRLPAIARDAIADPANLLFLSVASAWELAILVGLGRVKEIRSWPEFLADQIDRYAITVLPIHLAHVAGLMKLPPIHRDPFDRMLVAQAIVEKLALVTGDETLARTGVARIW
ncbi:MAG: type II toxin-antitoxin system VapC family toxin, partial [Pseudomonadota bacterium]